MFKVTVRSVGFVRLSTIRSQTELVVNRHVTVPDILQGGVDTKAIVSDIRRNILKSQEGLAANAGQ